MAVIPRISFVGVLMYLRRLSGNAVTEFLAIPILSLYREVLPVSGKTHPLPGGFSAGPGSRYPFSLLRRRTFHAPPPHCLRFEVMDVRRRFGFGNDVGDSSVAALHNVYQ